MIDISEDYLVFDNLIRLRYVDLSGVSYIFEKALLYPANDQPDASLDIALQTADTVFCVWTAELPFRFQTNAQIYRENGEAYSLIGFERKSLDQRWVLYCTANAGEHLDVVEDSTN